MTGSTPWAIPVSWRWTTAGDVADVVGGGTPASTDHANFSDDGIPWITPADLSGYRDKRISRGARNLSEKGLADSSARLMPPGAVLFSSRAPIGYVAIAGRSLATNQGFKSFVLQPGLLPDYVYYYLQRAEGLAVSLASGTTFLELSGKNAARLPIPLAPLQEQGRVAEAIESYLPRLDESEAALERVQRNLKRYRAAVLQAAVEGRLVPTEAELARAEGRGYEPASELLKRILAERRRRWEAAELARLKVACKAPKDDKWRVKYEEPAPPDPDGRTLPDGWCWASVDQLSVIVRGASPRPAGDPRYFGGPIPWITVGDLTADESPYLARVPGSLTERGRAASRFIDAGTLLLTNSGVTLGVPKITLIRGCINDGSVALLQVEQPLQLYLYYYLRTQTYRLRAINQGAAQPNLNTGIVKGIHVPLPPAVEQRRIIAAIEESLPSCDAARQTVEVTFGRSQRLRQSILKWAFEGKLVDQDPNDEPASVLLERIRAERAAQVQVPERRSRKQKAPP